MCQLLIKSGLLDSASSTEFVIKISKKRRRGSTFSLRGRLLTKERELSGNFPVTASVGSTTLEGVRPIDTNSIIKYVNDAIYRVKEMAATEFEFAC